MDCLIILSTDFEFDLFFSLFFKHLGLITTLSWNCFLWVTEIIVEEQAFAESKNSFEARQKLEGNNNLSGAPNLGVSNNASDLNQNLSSSLNNLDTNDSQILDELDDEDLPF